MWTVVSGCQVQRCQSLLEPSRLPVFMYPERLAIGDDAGNDVLLMGELFADTLTKKDAEQHT